jgi:hypothetical protein
VSVVVRLLVKDAVVLVEVAEFGAQIVVNANGTQRFGVVVDIPDLQREIVARDDVTSVAAKLDVRDRRDNL